jgi:hypothetical protein
MGGGLRLRKDFQTGGGGHNAINLKMFICTGLAKIEFQIAEIWQQLQFLSCYLHERRLS